MIHNGLHFLTTALVFSFSLMKMNFATGGKGVLVQQFSEIRVTDTPGNIQTCTCKMLKTITYKYKSGSRTTSLACFINSSFYSLRLLIIRVS